MNTLTKQLTKYHPIPIGAHITINWNSYPIEYIVADWLTLNNVLFIYVREPFALYPSRYSWRNLCEKIS